MDIISSPSGRTPSLYGAVVLCFPSAVDESLLLKKLSNVVEWRRIEDIVEVTYREVDRFVSWDIEDLLTVLFASCDLAEIVSAIDAFQGRVLIDISFHHYDSYPSLIFDGENMETIRLLHADISIDPY